MNRDFGRRGPLDNRGMGGSSGTGLLGPAPNMMNNNMGMDPRQRMMTNFGGSQAMGNNSVMRQGNMNSMQMPNMGQTQLRTPMGSNMGAMGNQMQPGRSSFGQTMRGNMPGPDEQLTMAINLLKGGSSAPQQRQSQPRPLLDFQGGFNRNTVRTNTNVNIPQLGKRSYGYSRGPDIKRIKPIIDQKRNFGHGDYRPRTHRSQDRESYTSRKDEKSYRDRHHSDDQNNSENEEIANDSDEVPENDLKDSALTVTVRSDERGRSVNEGPHDAEKEEEAANETKKNFCYACNSQCRSEQTFKDHLNGKRHKMRMEQLSIITEQKCHEITGRMQIEKQLRKIDGREPNRRRQTVTDKVSEHNGELKKFEENTSVETSAALIDLSEYEVPPYNPNSAQGQTYVIPVSGFFCKLCHKFYNNEVAAKDSHCKTKDHYDRFKKVMELKQMRLREKQASLIAQAVEEAEVFTIEDEDDGDSETTDTKDSRTTTPSIENKDEDYKDEDDEGEIEEMVIQDEANCFDDDNEDELLAEAADEASQNTRDSIRRRRN